MSFDTTFKYFAFDASVLGNASSLRDDFGEFASTAPDAKGENIKTLLCGLDNAETGALRAIVLGETAQPLILTDGRYCLGGYWSDALMEEVDAGNIDCEELTEAQLKSLMPVGEL